MNREEKNAVILELKEKIEEYGSFYITDTSGLSVAKINDIRRKCFNREIYFKVAKNTLIRKAMEATGADYTPLFDVLNGTSGVMFCKTGNVPAKLIKELRSEKGAEKPVLKGAFVVDHDFFIGDKQIDKLASIKSKDEVIGDIISALQSGGHKIAGILKTLSEKGE